ncbi:amino acid ABC transporter substrate-binding protein [uncultured Methanobrevibacter sp.]|uniref:amino acid ABC transporter substrate-binding protein n=1 Tax=uncultured Methanobrevibacter sp. TaxID=253161 RepID=UPI0025849612|nr:amino acid ABC transporter substrate-binding protein [uncultured Methanobrevibacter sp.]
MNKKILVSLSIMIIIVIGLLIVHFSYANLGGETSANDNDDNTLVVGFDAEFPPYGFKDDQGNYIGFDLDLAQEVCNRNNWTLKKQAIDWDSKDTELNSGSIDCIWSGFTMEGREDQYTWSKAYIDNRQVIVVKNDSDINSLSDLSGKTVETQKDSSALAALQGDQKSLAQSFKKLTQVADYNTAFMDLESGACDAVAVDYGVAKYQITTGNDSTTFKILEENISTEHYGIGFKKGNTELRDKVQKTLDEMYEDGTVQRIAKKYSNYGVPESLRNYTKDEEI